MTWFSCFSRANDDENQEPTKWDSDRLKGGNDLLYPVGQYLESKTPRLFKWKPIVTCQSQGLLVHRRQSSDSRKWILMARYDFTKGVSSAQWDRPDFPPGEYQWRIYCYGETSAEPIHIDSQEFVVEPIEQMGVLTHLFGLQAGLSRGAYFSTDSVYDISFDLSPTGMGLSYIGSGETWYTSTQFLFRDLVLNGASSTNLVLRQDLLFRVNGHSTSRFSYFLGLTGRIRTLPFLSSADGSVIQSMDLSIASFGPTALVQFDFNLNTFLYGQARGQLPVYSSEGTGMAFSTLNWSVHIGGMNTVYWPFGVGAEVSYVYDQNNFTLDNKNSQITMSALSILANVYYLF